MQGLLTNPLLIHSLNSGFIAVIPTDTIYGLVGAALNRKTVERIYRIKKRRPEKPFIILIASLDDLKLFGIVLDESTQTFLKKIWPNPVSLVLPCPLNKFQYLHRGTNSLAFRMPQKPSLRRLIKKTGPLVAPSANPEGFPPAATIREAKKYFSTSVDSYISAGRLVAQPSTLISIIDKKIKILRQGEHTINF